MSERPLSHFYHVYADGDWKRPVAEHLDALESSGLATALDLFGVGFVGNVDNRAEAHSYIDSRLPVDVLSAADSGWEQLTLQLLRGYAVGNVLYAHTKTAANYSVMHDRWRQSMTYFNITRWQLAVSYLSDHDTVGCHQVNPGDFWGGNYWWARSEWIAELPPLQYDNRYQAEAWIGLHPGRRHDLNPGFPAESIFVWSDNAPGNSMPSM